MSRISEPVSVDMYGTTLTYSNPLIARYSVAAKRQEYTTIEVIRSLCKEIDELKRELNRNPATEN